MKMNKLATVMGLSAIMMSAMAFADEPTNSADAEGNDKAVMEAFALVNKDGLIVDENGKVVDSFIVQLKHQGNDQNMSGSPTVGGSPVQLFVQSNSNKEGEKVSVSFKSQDNSDFTKPFFIKNANNAKMDFTIAVAGSSEELSTSSDKAELILSERHGNGYRAPLGVTLTSTDVYSTYASGYYKNNFLVLVQADN
ncbi:hypothetical protein [Aeromonas finlandensis]|uniref:hypothetical protein n=1 Tax=Aeromonas finlandensis TaxID=1543375 RepID=UPI00051CA742|nr:hypothetical protein [Aeromonas finlandensis]